MAEGKDKPVVTPVLIGWLKTNVPGEAMSDVAPSAKAVVELAEQDSSLLTPEEWKESKDLPRLPRFVAQADKLVADCLENENQKIALKEDLAQSRDIDERFLLILFSAERPVLECQASRPDPSRGFACYGQASPNRSGHGLS